MAMPPASKAAPDSCDTLTSDTTTFTMASGGRHQRLPTSSAEADRRSMDSSSGPSPAHSISVRSSHEGREQMEIIEPVQVYSSKAGASMLSSLFNLTNAIIGAGVIGLPYAMRQAGLLMGLLMVVGLALLVDWTLRVLALGSKLSGRHTYQGMVEQCFGRWGLLLSSVFQGTMAGGGMASFVVIVGDTLPHVLGSLMPQVAKTGAGRLLFSRRFVVAFFVVCLAYPLSLYRDVGKLGKTSAFAVVAMCTIIVSVVVEAPRLDPSWRADPAPIALVNAHVFQAIGIITFAFVCHHNSFMIHSALRKPTLNRYFDIVHIATGLATVASLVISICGYLSFGAKAQGNVLNNFPQDNLLINIARFLFALNMITTFPMEALVAREVITELFFPPGFSRTRHIAITTLLCAAALVVGETVCNLGVLLELTGGMSASFLAFILPSACYIRLSSAPMLSARLVPHWLCIAFGVVVMVLSTVLSIRHASAHGAAGSCW
ncbi:hypothetical protein GGI25_004345 [Coemansia spiralis]|uniref:Amino acid transporter transmembrane domain-containing protein n=2 Tax=Coemansia TaxID=4863 RepID=A0A9W8KXH6_9FUNG|nr:transmembrane amino acid transporter protein-domain-containing protein [Coemansia spiralis]KAJ1992068.1 hypothetical protein EDC05_003059 [Coemansia umbellata]KAJ2621430.1 hypothetical protein GGI26_004112 [Coemansia sp. RSA 1358]KAJ2674405.1 hypothetical protein GGI25_004345 [Coemansia spiralis]